MFRGYLYGYLNTFYNYIRLTGVDGKSYKQQKYLQTASYLKLDGYKKRFFLSSCKLLGLFENIIYFVSVTVQLISLLIHKTISGNTCKIYQNENCVYVYGYGAWNLTTLISKAGIKLENVVFVTCPCRDNSVYDKYKRYDLTMNLTIREVLSSYTNSIRLIYYIKHKYGYRDVLFHANNSFEYFLVYSFYLKHPEVKLCYVDLYDRWAYLFGSLKNHKTLIQHGMLIDGMPFVKKVGDVDDCYVFNEEQLRILHTKLIGKIGRIHYLPTLKLTGSVIQHKNNKKDIMIICSHFYFAKEKKMVDLFYKSEKWNIYMKPHPLDDIEPYKEFSERFDVGLLGKVDFPMVDLAVSYASTLALEYQMAGVPVLQYDDSDFEEKLKKFL